MSKKRVLGQFFTKDTVWLKPQVISFIKTSSSTIAYDPFAGDGDLLKAAQKYCNISEIIGLDIDKNLNWKHNDSLLNIPPIEHSIIITNPPYISNYSAARKGIDAELQKYFSNTDYPDVYMIALDKMLATGQKVVAIIPETFINSKYKQKDLLHSITILEENPFNDTENPVIVACFDNKSKHLNKIEVYKNESFVNSLANIERLRIKPSGNLPVEFNDINGWLAVRCVDTTNPADMIKFDFKENINYDWENRIKVSSRLLTLINLEIPLENRSQFIVACNQLLFDIRDKSSDIILSPFKGNMKNGRRRRRLDFMTCRAIIEQAYKNMYGLRDNAFNQDLKLTNTTKRIEYAQQQTLF